MNLDAYNDILTKKQWIPETVDDIFRDKVVRQSLAQVQRLVLESQLDKLNPRSRSRSRSRFRVKYSRL